MLSLKNIGILVNMARKKHVVKHKQTPVILIAAIQKDRGIGNQGKLLYQFREDMEHFKNITSGHTVIMGRKTWESLPATFRPLPNRENIVISRDSNYKAEGAIVVNRFYQALEKANPDKKMYVIGGGEIYRQALSYADTLELTIIEGNQNADTFFPEYENYFQEESSSQKYISSGDSIPFRFVTFIKK